MDKTRFSENVLREIENCARCGKCRSVCPVFSAVKDEAFVARGRIVIASALANAEIAVSKETSTIMSACLMCRRCSEVCPSGVEFSHILAEARECVANELGLQRGFSWFFRHVLPHRNIFDFIIRLAAFGQKIIPGQRAGSLRHLPLLVKGGKYLPPLAPVSALRAHAKPGPVSHANMRVGIFIGCLINYVYPDIAGAAVKLLNKANIEAVIPSSQVCCGTPVLAFGDRKAAQLLVNRNVHAFRDAGCEYILTLCASCGTTLRSEYSKFAESSGFPFGIPVLDVAEFLEKHATLVLDPQPVDVTYHDPCHLRWGQGVYREPRSLLNRCAVFEESPGEMSCCGMAGAFHVLFPEMAEAIAQRKLDSIRSTNCQKVATGCPGCILQLNDLFARANSQKRAVHLVEILANSTRGSGENR